MSKLSSAPAIGIAQASEDTLKKLDIFDMAPRQGKFDVDAESATVPGPTVDKSLGAPPMTRTAAALDYAEAAVKMRRRRINKSAVHRELGLLQRALATFVGDFNVRLAALKTMTFYDTTTTTQLKKVAVVAGKQKRGQRGGARMQRKKGRMEPSAGSDANFNPAFEAAAGRQEQVEKAKGANANARGVETGEGKMVAGVEWCSHSEMRLGQRKKGKKEKEDESGEVKEWRKMAEEMAERVGGMERRVAEAEADVVAASAAAARWEEEARGEEKKRKKIEKRMNMNEMRMNDLEMKLNLSDMKKNDMRMNLKEIETKRNEFEMKWTKSEQMRNETGKKFSVMKKTLNESETEMKETKRRLDITEKELKESELKLKRSESEAEYSKRKMKEYEKKMRESEKKRMKESEKRAKDAEQERAEADRREGDKKKGGGGLEELKKKELERLHREVKESVRRAEEAERERGAEAGRREMEVRRAKAEVEEVQRLSQLRTREMREQVVDLQRELQENKEDISQLLEGNERQAAEIALWRQMAGGGMQRDVRF